MSVTVCAYCGQPKPNHSRRCSVARHGAEEMWMSNEPIGFTTVNGRKVPLYYRPERDYVLAKAQADAKMWEDVANEYLEDLRKLGNAFAELHCQAINGVVCDPTDERGPRSLCESCYGAWVAGRKVLDTHDPSWNNLFRPGPRFQPGALPMGDQQSSSTNPTEEA